MAMMLGPDRDFFGSHLTLVFLVHVSFGVLHCRNQLLHFVLCVILSWFVGASEHLVESDDDIGFSEIVQGMVLEILFGSFEVQRNNQHAQGGSHHATV